MKSNLTTSVTQVCTFYGESGGLEKVVLDLVSGLKTDFQTEVLCCKTGIDTSRKLIDGVAVTSVGSPMSIAGRPLSLTFPAELSKISTDIIHYHLPFPLAAASHLLVNPKAKAVATWHHDLIRYNWFNTLWKPYQKTFLERLSAIAVSSPALIENTPALAPFRDKCHVIPFGVNLERFTNINESLVATIKNRYKQPLILFVGRLVYYKGCEVLINAMKDIPASLAIVGDGPLRNDFKKLSQDLQLTDKITFLGNLSNEELTAYYQACDIFVLPSTLATECFGMVQIEAMAAGKPVVNTSLPTGVPWVSYHEQTGLTVEPNNVAALTEALNKLVSDPSLRKTLGQNGQQRVKKEFLVEDYVKNTADLYRQILHST